MAGAINYLVNLVNLVIKFKTSDSRIQFVSFVTLDDHPMTRIVRIIFGDYSQYCYTIEWNGWNDWNEYS